MNNLKDTIIVGPWGGIGNHIRWLLLIDNLYDFKNTVTISNWNKDLYDVLKGKNWPEYNPSFCEMPEIVRTECIQSVPMQVKVVKFDNKITNVLEKTDFISTQIYPKTRSWHNWLHVEFLYRDWANDCIEFDHYLIHTNVAQYKKRIGITIDPEIAARHFMKFDSSFGGYGKRGFIKEVERQNETIIKNSEIFDLIIDAGELYKNDLNYNIYINIIRVLGLDDNFNFADKIHKTWYNLQKTIEKNFVIDIANMYKN
jgi:hypothetical protein